MDTSKPETLSERLDRAQANAARIRCEAFVDYAPVVAGERLRPITLGTYNALFAFGNAFVTGGAIAFEDIAGFVWLHHPNFGQFNRREKKAVTRRVYAALRPSFPNINGALAVISEFPRFKLLRRFVVAHQGQRVGEAIAEIRRLISEAAGEMPRGDESGEPMPFAQPAQVLNLFRRYLGMSFEETRRIPMKQLAQHLRELAHHLSDGKAILLTPEEAALWREHLTAKPLAA